MTEYIKALIGTHFEDAEEGQTMAEYAVVLAVITVAILVALTALSGGISTALKSVTDALKVG